MKTTMKILGGPQLAKNFEQLSTRLSLKVQREALIQAGEPLKASMAQLAPVKPGAPDLAANMVISPARSGWRDRVAITIGPAKEFFYGLFQEFGTRHHRAQPFMRPTFDRMVVPGQTLGVIKAALWDALIRRGFGSSRTGGGVGL